MAHEHEEVEPSDSGAVGSFKNICSGSMIKDPERPNDDVDNCHENREIQEHTHDDNTRTVRRPQNFPPTPAQATLAWFLMDVLMYVTVINLFVEFIPRMTIKNHPFTISILTAVVIKVVLEGVHFLQHKVKHFFCQPRSNDGNKKPPCLSKLIGGILIWLVLFGSKFLILWIDEIIFQDLVNLGGVKLILVLSLALMIVENLLRIGWAQLGHTNRWLTLQEVGQAAFH